METNSHPEAAASTVKQGQYSPRKRKDTAPKVNPQLAPLRPKYRRQVIYKDIRADVGQILGTLCRRKGIEIIEAQCMPDHIHMLVRIPPKYSVSEIVGYLKGKSSLMIFEKHANLKYKYGNRHFWCRGYYVDTVGKNTAAIKTYIQNQIKEDLEYDQMTLVEYIDPFTGEPVKKNKK